MLKFIKIIFLLIVLNSEIVYTLNPTSYVEPEQIHISYGAKIDQMVVTWVTFANINHSVVEYGLDSLDLSQNGSYDVFTDGGLAKIIRYIHRVVLNDLKPNSRYFYHCGSPKYGWSSLYYFNTQPAGPNWSPRFAVYGDLGNVNAQSLTRLQEETILGYYDAILHVGDFAYDMANENGKVGDAFMNQIQPIAAYLPYMTCVGNHENLYNFSNYKNLFSMPGQDGVSFGNDNNFFYSVNIGPVHLIGFSTEFYYFYNYGFKQIKNQYEWLENDLKVANLPENRALRPWIITMGHRPMYCTNNDNDDCTKFDDRVRTGMPIIHVYGLEDLFMKYGVDVEFWAHEHSYERLWPIYNYKVFNGSLEEPYTNPGAPVHIITGSAGCSEGHEGFLPATNFTAFRNNDYGYTRMQVFNASHLYIEQVSDDQDGKVVDSIWIIKDKHGSF